MNALNSAVDPVPPSAYPSLQSVTTPQPAMPAFWAATVLLHPFSPPLSTDPTPDNPFFQLCVADISYSQGEYFSAQVSGCSYGNWWYFITAIGTQLSTDGGNTWKFVDMGWTLPENWYGAQGPNAACAGASPLNWMDAQTVDWWKIPVPLKGSLSAATWMWFDSITATPVRMMFGNGPPSPTMGDPTQLAFFQMCHSRISRTSNPTTLPARPPRSRRPSCLRRSPASRWGTRTAIRISSGIRTSA